MFILAVLVVTIEMNFAHHFIIVLIVIIFIIFDVLYFEPMYIRPVQWAFWDSFFRVCIDMLTNTQFTKTVITVSN